MSPLRSTLKALILQQDEIVRDRVVAQLASLGSFEIQSFSRGRDARSSCREFGPDIIIVDSSIDDLSTAELVQRCKTEAPGIRVVVTTESVESESASKPLHRLADAILWRPFGVWELRQVVEDQMSALTQAGASARA